MIVLMAFITFMLAGGLLIVNYASRDEVASRPEW